MTAGEDQGGVAPAPPIEGATFELERFAWGAPDRLELSGSFVGLPAPPADPPVLVVHGAERMHRLPAAPDSAPDTPEDGRPWRAEFAWQEAPVVFHVAQLQLGGDITVDLPAPGDAEPQSLELRHERIQDDDPVAAPPGSPATPPAGGAERLRLEAELLATQEAAGELRAAAERAHEELTRAHADLEAEREGRAADAERFRAGLARVRESAEAALNEAHDAAQAREVAVEKLRAEFDAAVAARMEAESAAADAQTLRERLDRVESAEAIAEEARAEAEVLLERLTTMRDALAHEE